MERGKSIGLRVLTVLLLAALPELAWCQLDGRVLPPEVVCEAEGRFPDPTDCAYYIDCASNGGGGFTKTITPCPGGTYYDSCRGDCSRTAPTPDCSVSCSFNGVVTVSRENPSIYFVCTVSGSRSYLHVAKCNNGNTVGNANSCDGPPSGCSVNNNPSPGGSTCTGIYYYGDEKDCSVYYYCSGAGATPDQASCDPGQYFISYNHSCVEFVCTSVGTFADPANCRGFYLCASDASGYVKVARSCPAGYQFDSSVGACAVGDCTTVCPGSSTDFTCTSSGFFADPRDCTSYYYCSSNLEASHYHCSPGSYYDSSAGICIIGECPNTGTGFKCTSPGGYFADPLDCTSFYYCSSNLEATQYHCPAGSYFDSAVGGCMVGSCSNTLVSAVFEAGVPSLHSISSPSIQHGEIQDSSLDLAEEDVSHAESIVIT